MRYSSLKLGYPTLQILSNDLSKASNLQSPFESQDFTYGYNPTRFEVFIVWCLNVERDEHIVEEKVSA